jgi:arylformamidase
MTILDISVALGPDSMTWPGHPATRLEALKQIDVHGVQTSVLHTSTHTATHVDAPCHFIRGGKDVAALSLEAFIGPVHVIDITGATVSASELETTVPAGAERLLFRTKNRDRWPGHAFDPNYVGVDESGARFLADRPGLRLCGIDYPSIAMRQASTIVHETLLGRGIHVLEGIDLKTVEPGLYHLICLPLKLIGADGAPARAVLTTVSASSAG